MVLVSVVLTSVLLVKFASSGSGASPIWVNPPVESVNGYTGVVTLDPDDLDDTSSANKFMTLDQTNKLAGIEENATADQTGSEIKALYEAEADTNAFNDALLTKLQNIEANANNLQVHLLPSLP